MKLHSPLTPKFARKATKQEAQEIQELIKKYIPFDAKSKVDHFFIVTPKQTREELSPGGFFPYVQEVQNFYKHDMKELSKTACRQGRVNAYVLHKMDSFMSTEKECQEPGFVGWMARTNSKIQDWMYQNNLQKYQKYGEYYRKASPWLTEIPIKIPGVGLLIHLYGIKPPSQEEMQTRIKSANQELAQNSQMTGFQKLRFTVEEAVLNAIAKILGA